MQGVRSHVSPHLMPAETVVSTRATNWFSLPRRNRSFVYALTRDPSIAFYFKWIFTLKFLADEFPEILPFQVRKFYLYVLYVKTLSLKTTKYVILPSNLWAEIWCLSLGEGGIIDVFENTLLKTVC